MIAFYTVVMLLSTGEILYSLAMGFIYGLTLTAFCVILVAAWRIVTGSVDRA